jgi:transposase
MLNFSSRRLFLATQPVDLRKSFDSLSAFVSQHFSADPFSGDAFLFIGKRKNLLKILIWENSGFWLCSKRLEQGTFSFLQILLKKTLF